MLTFDEIKREYSTDLHSFDRGLVREYLQYQILGIVFTHPLGKKLSFLGGTCLRIVYKLNRFSEDIDFDNKNLTEQEFIELSIYVEKELQKLGFHVQIKNISKEAFHCYIKFPKLLFEQGLSPFEEEKIIIQLDTFDQEVNYESGLFIIDKFDIFKQIRVTPKSVILSQKLWTITQRKRFKGRDFYDAMFLMQSTKPDIEFLNKKFGTDNMQEIKNIVLSHTKDVNWNILITDLEPFMTKKEDAGKIRLFNDFLKQTEL